MLFVSSVTRKRYHLVVKVYCTSPLLCNFDGAPRLRNHNSDMGVKCECESEARDLARHRVDQRIQKKVRRAGMQERSLYVYVPLLIMTLLVLKR